MERKRERERETHLNWDQTDPKTRRRWSWADSRLHGDGLAALKLNGGDGESEMSEVERRTGHKEEETEEWREAWDLRLECMILDLGLKDPKQQTWKRKTVKGKGGYFFFLLIIYNPVPGSRFNRVFWKHEPGTGYPGLPGFKKPGTYPGPVFRFSGSGPVITGPDFLPYQIRYWICRTQCELHKFNGEFENEMCRQCIYIISHLTNGLSSSIGIKSFWDNLLLYLVFFLLLRVF